ncbi:hypothetical protein B0J18DRAFT_393313 [Chaetomium sp. MPI-SDFR-AT-0129]|nr:hypothetical protein B0J18DRAFT_393313 [Chaetomium sp. MPI-SDFR-AT-0129]
MAGMARHGSVGAYNGFSVCQPALGASLQWLPAIGTAELDDMINAFLPGPASIQDKRAHISMDFFEYCRLTGETLKFYPLPATTFTPVTASPATSVLYDSGYASSFNHSPVLSDQGSWTQSPLTFGAATSEAKTKSSRSSVSKKSSSSSSRQQTVDFASHPGMRILTKDGRDVTNSASRGCKTKEQRDHAHLMRIIKACDACKKKKVRCDPSHRKRTASQTSPSQSEQKPAKKAKKAEEPPPAPVVNAAAMDFTPAGDFTAETFDFSSLEVDNYLQQDSEEFWNEFIALDQAPAPAVNPATSVDDFLFDSFTDFQSFISPSSDSSSSTPPSQILTPVTPDRSRQSPIAGPVSDLTSDVADVISSADLSVPYLNPGVAHGTDYMDFNLYSPGPEVYEEDPVLQLRELGSQQHSPQSTSSVASHTSAHSSPRRSEAGVVTQLSEPGQQQYLATSPRETWYYDPGDTPDVEAPPGAEHASTNRRLTTNHNRLIGETHGGYYSHRRAASDGSLAGSSRVAAQSTTAESHAPLESSASSGAVFANSALSSVSPSRIAEPRRITTTVPATAPRGNCIPAPPAGPLATIAAAARQPGTPDSDAYVKASPPAAIATAAAPRGRASLRTTLAARPTVLATSSRKVADGTVRAGALGSGKRYTANLSDCSADRCSLDTRPLEEQQHAKQQPTVAGNVALATTVLFSTLPTRRNVAGEGVPSDGAFFFQLAVFGLVSILCASAVLQQYAHSASQISLVNILAITSMSLARFALWRAGPPSRGVSSIAADTKTLPPSGLIDNIMSMGRRQSVVTGCPTDQRSSVSRWARSILPRLRTSAPLLGM